MAREILWGNIPEGFKKIQSNGRVGLVRAGMESSLDLSNLSRAKSAESGFRGRGMLDVCDLYDGGAALIRRYRHGGALRGLTGDFFFTWPPRPFRELASTEEARRRGVSTVEPLAALIEPVAGIFYRGWLVTRRIDGARDAWAVSQAGDIPSEEKASWLKAAALAVSLMHRLGVDHRDLNLKNILLRREADGWRGYVIDLDKARLLSGSVPRDRVERNLARLARSVRKLDPGERFFSARDWQLFLTSYREAG
jgi:tRNA A-37 threonylcarbamoyl transferase component Bud32